MPKENKKGLGKGLNALFGENVDIEKMLDDIQSNGKMCREEERSK